MHKYDIEGGVDFYAELNKPVVPVAIDDEMQLCLLTKSPLTYGHITLPCKHVFNFLPLYNEVLSQKTNPELLKNVYHVRLNKNHMKCPYCRIIHADALLPYIVGDKRVNGVNGPAAICMPAPFKCQHTVSKTTGRGGKKQTTVIECAAVKNIYCTNCSHGDGSTAATTTSPVKFLCKKHQPK